MTLLLTWNEWLSLRESKTYKKAISKKKIGGISPKKQVEKRPNYSFDQWLKKVEDLGKDVKNLVDKSKDEEKELEKKEVEKKQAEKSNKPEKFKKPDKAEKSKKDKSHERSEKESELKDQKTSDKDRHEDTWNKISQKETKPEKDSTKKPTKPTKPTKTSGEP